MGRQRSKWWVFVARLLLFNENHGYKHICSHPLQAQAVGKQEVVTFLVQLLSSKSRVTSVLHSCVSPSFLALNFRCFHLIHTAVILYL